MVLSGYFTYLVCINTMWYFFFLAFLFVIPIWLVIFGIWVVVLFIWGSFIKKKEYGFSPLYYFIVKNTDTWAIKLLRIHVKKKGFDKLPKEKCLYIINHNSNFDPMLMIMMINTGPLLCVTKPENFSFPIAGPFIRRAGYIDIDRDDPRKAIKAINRASRLIEEDKANVCICPEGTRNKSDAPLLPFHPGSFKIGTKASCPIVLIDLKNTRSIKKNAPWKSSTIEANVVSILREEDYKDMSTNQIAELCEKKMLEDFLAK